MAMWIFMFILALPIPVIMITLGKYMISKGYKQVSDWVGYRTKLSKTNKDTWEFAQKYYGRLLYKPGFICLIFVLIVMLSLLGKSTDTVAIGGAVAETIPIAYMLIIIIPTERAIKRTFNQDGSYKIQGDR